MLQMVIDLNIKKGNMEALKAIEFIPYYIARTAFVLKFIIKLILKNTNIYRE